MTASALARDAAGPAAAVDVRSDVADEVWDRFVEAEPSASAYHRIGWARLIGRAFGHEVHPLAALRDGAVVGVLPLVVMKSPLFGRHAVSLPVLNAGGVVARDVSAAAALLDAATAVARHAGVKYLELRHTTRVYPSLTERRHKVAMTLALPDTPEALFQKIDRKARNLVRKGEKAGLTFDASGVEGVNDFYEVFSRNMRDLGTPVFTKRLFEEVMTTFPANSRVLTARHEGKPVASAIVHWRNGWMEVPWASTLREANPLAANMFLYWRTLEFAIAQGCRLFEFGRCTPDEGTFHFKKQWGAEPSPLVWEYWTPGAPPTFSLNQKEGAYSRASDIWSRLPLGVTRAVGPHIVRGIPC